MAEIKLYNGDCLEVMDNLIKTGIKVDCIITDPPYGSTKCSWDIIIPFDEMWNRIKNIRKENACICLFGNEPFSSSLRLSNVKEYKYDLYWEKEAPVNILQLKRRFGKNVETISVFYKKQCTYNPQKYIHIGKKVSNVVKSGMGRLVAENGLKALKNYEDDGTRYPKQILKYNRVDKHHFVHPTQKPVELLECLVKSFTNEGDTVLDFTMGSGSTGVACKNLNRNFIGIELDENYFKIAKERIEKPSN